MRYLVGILFFFFIHNSYAKEVFTKDCSHLQSINEADFVLFSKKEFIELGECLAVSLIKKKEPINLVESCNEVDEDRRNLLGVFSLSKLEAILMGQCVGAISYIYDHYDNEAVSIYGYRRNHFKKYQCIKGLEAIDIVRKSSLSTMNRTELRELICIEV